MKMEFFKYHGTGNDFIIVDNRELHWEPTQEEVARLCDRHFGIGADGLMLLTVKEGYDFGMNYYNSDGNESTMCGNGGRCMAAFTHRIGLAGRVLRFHAADGGHEAEILEEGVDTMVVSLRMKDVTVEEQRAGHLFLDTGSPHCIVFTEHADQVDLVREARKIRYDACFAGEGTNVNFVEQREDHLYVRSYERGVEDETLSCGTGVTASALAAALKDPSVPGFYRVLTKGGQLTVRFTRQGNRFTGIRLEGPARFVFKGQVESNG